MRLDAIVLLHWGNPDYLKSAVLRIKVSNPNQRVILIGDHSNAHLADIVEHYMVTQFSNRGKTFRQNYIHLSANEVTYERCCIERWFIVAELVQCLGIRNFMHIDSDVLIYGSMDQAAESLGDFDMSLSYGTCAHASFWNIEVVEKFCCYVGEFGCFSTNTVSEGFLQQGDTELALPGRWH